MIFINSQSNWNVHCNSSGRFDDYDALPFLPIKASLETHSHVDNNKNLLICDLYDSGPS